MTDFRIKNKFSRTTRCERGDFSGLRVYRQSPFNANLQVWTSTDRQTLIANMPLHVDDCLALAAMLTTLAAELKALELAKGE